MISRCMLFVRNNWKSDPLLPGHVWLHFPGRKLQYSLSDLCVTTPTKLQLVLVLLLWSTLLYRESRSLCLPSPVLSNAPEMAEFFHYCVTGKALWVKATKGVCLTGKGQKVGLWISDSRALDRAGQQKTVAVIWFAFSILSGSSREARTCLVSSLLPWPRYLVQGLEQNDSHWAALSLCLSLPEISGRRHLFLQIAVSRLSLWGYWHQLSTAAQPRFSHRLWPHFQRSPHNLIS